MAQRYDIVKIDFQANARGANAAIEALRQQAEKCNARVVALKEELKTAINANMPADQIEALRSKLNGAQKDARQFSNAYKELVKGMRTLDQGIKAFNDGTLNQMNQAFQKAVYNAAKLTRTKLDPMSDSYKKDYRELTSLMDASQQNYARLQGDAQQMLKTLRDGGKVSRQALTEELNAQKELLQVLAETDKGYQRTKMNVEQLSHYLQRMGGDYDYIRQNITDTQKVSDEMLRTMYRELEQTNNEGKVTKKMLQENAKAMREIRAEQERRVQNVLGGDLSKQSEGNIRTAIANAKELMSVYGSTSKQAQTLAAQIVNAEEHLKQHGIEGERAARKEAEAVQLLADKHKMMQDRVKNLGNLSTSALAETQKYWEAQRDGAERTSTAYKKAEKNLKAINAEMQRQATAQLQTDANKLGRKNLATLSEQELQTSIAAAKQLAQAMDPADASYKQLVADIIRAEEHVEKFGLAGETSTQKQAQQLQQMVDRMASLSNLSDAALQETKKFWEAQVAGTEKGKAELAEYEARLKAVKDEEQERNRIANEQKAGIVRSESFNIYSLAEIRESIAAAKELHSHMASASPDAQRLAESIAKAEEHVKRYGGEAARVAQSNETMRRQFQTMIDELNRGIMPTASAIKAQQNYWRKLIEDPKTAKESLQEYRDQLKEVDKMQEAMVKINGETAFQWFQNGSYKDASTNKVKEMAADLKAYRDSLPQETAAARIQQIDQWLQKTGQSAKKAAEDMMSLDDALELAAKAGENYYLQNNKEGFVASPQQIQAATKAINERRDAVIKLIQENKRLGLSTEAEEEELQDLTKKLRDLKFEEDNVNMSQEKMRRLMEQPAQAVSLDELRAAIKRADGELRRMEGSLGKNSKEYKAFAEQVKTAKNTLKDMEGAAKASASAWEKAWSRLKTYVGLYMGFNIMWQKVTGMASDAMQLSDKMGEVRKTTGFTADEVGRLSENLKKLDTRTDLTTLMSMAAKAGQLGLKTEEEVLGFTRAANMMMVALPEMGEEAATEMMKVAIATGEVKKIQEQMSQGLVEGSSATEVAMTKIASTIDQLRANSAAAAPAITDFVKRVGAVGAQSGISIDQVAALGATVDALGMRVEMSATALSRMIPAIKNNAYEIGAIIGKTEEDIKRRFAEGRGMEVILDVFRAIRERSGITAADIENDAEGAADKVEKLMEAAGFQDVIKVLNQQGARAGIVFAGLSQNIEELERNLGTAAVAYDENIAILNEYNKMNETTAAKWERLKNQVEEAFVSDQTQKALGGIIDRLRFLVDLLTGNVSGALKVVADLLKMFLLYWGVLKIGLGEAIFIKAIDGFKAMGAGLTGLIGQTQKYILYSRLMNKAQHELKMASDATSVALAKQKVAAIEARMAQEGLNKAMIANVWVALATAIAAAIYYIVTWEKELTSAEKALADLNAKMEEEKSKLDNLYNAYKQAEGNTIKRKGLMEEMNKSYGKYIGFLLTDAENTNLMAMAHERAADAMERELLAREKEQGISSIRQEKREELTKDFASFNDDLRKFLKLTSEEIGKVDLAMQEFLGQIKYDSRGKKYIYPEGTEQLINQYLASIGASKTTFKDLDPEQVVATWVDRYLRENFPKANFSNLFSVTGVQHGAGGKWTNFTPMLGSTFRQGYAQSYIELIEEIGKYEDMVNGQIAASDEKRSENTKKHVETLKKAADDAVKVITDNNSASEDIATAYESLATAINGLKAVSEDLKNNPIKITIPYAAPAITTSDVDNIINSAPWSNKKIDQNRLQAAIDRQQSQFTINTGTNTNGGGGGGGGGGRGAYGNYDKRVDPYEQWDANALVKRREEMLKRVRALAGGADVQKVLSMDKKFMDEATRKGIKDMRSAIAWYNEERLKIQEELDARNLTPTGDWKNPEKGGRSKKKPKTPESEGAIAELDRYYSERKELIEEARANEQMTEAEYNRRLDALEQEHLQKRSDLRKTFTSEDKQFIQQFRQWWASVAELDDVSWTAIEAEWIAAWERDRKYNNREAQKDLTAMQAIVVKQLKEIEAIIAKERPFNGITDNLQNNLTKMGLLFKDGVPEDGKFMEENTKRLTFLLKEAENAYSLTFDQLAEDMRKNGLGSWADAIINSENADKEKRAITAQLHEVYDQVQDAIKKEASQVKKQVDIAWNDAILPNGKSMKATYEAAISALGVEQSSVSRANNLIGAGVASERVADKLAIKQLQLQLRMQEHYYNLVRKTGQQRVDDLLREAKLREDEGKTNEAERLRLDAKHATMALNLSLAKEETELAKQREEIIARTEESQNRLYTELRSWADLLTSSLQGVFEASHAGDAEYYNERAKLDLTGKGGPGAGTYVVIDDAGTSDAKAHYEYLDERQALERQHEIEIQNAQAEAWKKLMDDLNMKMSEQITDWLNAALQNQSIDANTQATIKNTEALVNATNAFNSQTGTDLGSSIANGIGQGLDGTTNTDGTGTGAQPGLTTEQVEEWKEALGDNPMLFWQEQSDLATEKMLANMDALKNGQQNAGRSMQQSAQTTFAKMTAAANLYGIAYQAMSNENLSTTQKFEMIALQSVGNFAISSLTAFMSKAVAEGAVNEATVLGKLWSQLGWAAAPVFAIFTGLLGAAMGAATSAVSKSKSQIAQATGSSVGAGRLATGMLTYAEGNVNELTDPASLTPGRQYNVDGADGKTYRARYMGKGAKTHITNGPEFHLVGEAGREAIIDAKTTRLLQMNETGIWRDIQTLYNGGSISGLSTRRRRGGVRAFAEGNVGEFEEMADGGGLTAEGTGDGMSADVMTSMLETNSRLADLLENALVNGIKAVNKWTGSDGIPAMYNKMQKEAQRHGEKYL